MHVFRRRWGRKLSLKHTVFLHTELLLPMAAAPQTREFSFASEKCKSLNNFWPGTCCKSDYHVLRALSFAPEHMSYGARTTKSKPQAAPSLSPSLLLQHTFFRPRVLVFLFFVLRV